MYVSEKTDFNDFNDSSALIWTKLDLWYGDFYSGENQDGTYSFSTTLPTSEVNYKTNKTYLVSVSVKGSLSRF